ncbi:MAG: hypothetical protein BWK79_02135 [Beggiatoa sp. IS2]|nr:MAG: hypothetical protein BWK79_02135 [Beggiatoa sp. IS2]
MAEKPTLFQNEEEVLEQATDFLEHCANQESPLKEAYRQLLKDYKRLLKQTKTLVKMSDKQQNQLTTRVEQTTRTHEKKLAQFLEAVSLGVLVVDVQGRPYYANQKAQQILGKDISPDSIATEFPQIYQAYLAGTTQPYPAERQPVVQALYGKISSVDDIEIRQEGNKIIPLEVWGTPIFDEHNNVSYAIAVFQDITERKRAEQERLHFTEELALLNEAYERFVPHQFLSLLGKRSITDIQLGDHIEKEMTILFSDIRDFTALSEKMTPKQNFDFLNSYLKQMEPIISEYHGFIDKYIGDGIMALFPKDADSALQGAIAMLHALAHYNEGRRKANYIDIRVGIGINTGQLMLGTIGGENRMDSTVVADTVNLASRVEGLTKIYSTPLLITEQTHLKLVRPSRYQIRVIDAVAVKGKSELVTIYEVFDADSPESILLKRETLSEFEEGFVLYHWGEFNESRAFFEKVLETNKEDKVAQIYLQRCEYFQKYGVPRGELEEIGGHSLLLREKV